MKTLISNLAIALLVFLSYQPVQGQSFENQAQNEAKQVELKVTGMTCAGCASQVYKVLSQTAGIMDNEVKYPGDIAVVKFDPFKIQPQEIIRIIEEKTNFKAELLVKDES